MDEQRFWDLVSLKLSREATAEELAELEILLQQYPAMELKLDVIAGIWNERMPAQETGDSFQKHLQRLNKSAQPEEHLQATVPTVPHKKSRTRYYVAAAVITAITACGMLFLKQSNTANSETTAQVSTVSTKKGTRTSVQLPDGTRVWLNADSRLYYDELFTNGSREVTLEGEAFFDVQKDTLHPFIIHTDAVDITVMGTRFNVRAYKDEDETETALISGKVEVSVKNNPEKKIILRPNEKLVVKHEMPDGPELAVKEEELLVVKNMYKDPVYKTSPEIMWIDNKLVFDGEKLQEVCKKLERWYNITIRIEDDELKDGIYTAVFDGESLQNVLTALQITDPIDFSIEGDLIRIFKKSLQNKPIIH